jgi:hypothetical protein
LLPVLLRRLQFWQIAVTQLLPAQQHLLLLLLPVGLHRMLQKHQLQR